MGNNQNDQKAAEKAAAEQAEAERLAAEQAAAEQAEAEKSAKLQAEAEAREKQQAKAEEPPAAKPVPWKLPDYAGPLDITQAQWRMANLKPAPEARKK